MIAELGENAPGNSFLRYIKNGKIFKSLLYAVLI